MSKRHFSWKTTLMALALVACGDPSEPTPVLASITVAATPGTVKIGETAQATGTAKSTDGQTITIPADSVVWTTSAATIATVSAAGLVTAVSPGTASITATARGKSGSASVVVSAAQLVLITQPAGAVSGAALTTQPVVEVRDVSTNTKITTATSPVTASVGVGTGTLAGATVNAVAGVATFSGLSITGTGAVSLAFASPNLTSATATSLTVTAPSAPVASVSVTPGSGSVIAGGAIALTATTRDAGNNILTGRVVTWLSSNTSVATVNSSTGAVTAVAPGTTNVTASSEGQTSAAVVITIVPALAGNVALTGGAGVGGGIVEVRSGTTIVQTATVAAGGAYTVPLLAPGSYTVMLQPPLTHSMGPLEPTQQNLTITANQAASSTQSFVVQAAVYSDDFQSYTTTAQLTQGCGAAITAGNFFAGTAHDMNCSNQANIFLDATGGPQNSKAMRYDWPARPTGTGSFTVTLQPRFNPPPGITSSLYIRWTDKLSSGFRVGGAGLTGSGLEYKYIFVDLNAVGTSLGTFVFEMDSKTTTPSDQLTVRTKLVDGVSTSTDSDPNNFSLGTGFIGNYHTWVMEITGIGGATVTYKIWLDGTVIQTITGPFFPTKTLGGTGTTMTVELGANINNGPDLAQSRWFREFGVYTSRPSLRQLPP